MKIVGIALLTVGMAVVAMGTTVPEINPGSGVSAMALLSGALLVIRGTRKN